MPKTLKIATDLSLPLTAVTETFGVLAMRGAGKSNLAAVMAEQMFDAGLPFVVIDPVGSWYGLRAGADGSKDGGLPIPIFGGAHGDVPLERHGGELLADLVTSKRLSCVLDLTGFESEGAKKAFLLDFARRLYLKNADPLHLFLEEADDYLPQRPMRDEAQLLRAWENIVRRGRSRGLGMTLITQRSASVNKSVLTQVQTLFVLRTTGPQDRAAIEAWVKYHDTDSSVLASLSSLKAGQGWAWSPQFLERMSQHQFSRRRTFDSGATPKNLRGKDARPVATLADVDLGALQEQMSATLERAKADDPTELRKQLADRDREIQDLRKSRSKNSANYSDSMTTPQPLLTDADRELLRALREDFETFSKDIGARGEGLLGSMVNRARAAIDEAAERWTAELTKRRALFLERLEKTRVQRLLEKLDRVSAAPAPPPRTRLPAHVQPNAGHVRQPAVAHGSGDASLKAMHRAMLTALAQHPDGLSKKQILIHTGYASSGPVSTAFADLVRLGAVESVGRGLQVTTEGLRLLGTYTPLPVGDALREWLLSSGKLSTMEAALLRAVCHAYPNPIRKGDVLTATGYASSGPVSSAFAKLVGLNYVRSQGPSVLVASEELFG